ncbi:hypothetical protein [Sulfurimonas marina]|uniref:Peptidase C-terminal archaeal/bacterial domain-containing protein n=1 Tax=Sulfurimonas marina TaxID=2590551 RepID=A0A7M1AWJ7_9BACT|nr:hypothetical protein [Sulfurimonas marina]QOP41696.1 hypothetical protein FJR03_08080 [Sulfurimonas marina]
MKTIVLVSLVIVFSFFSGCGSGGSTSTFSKYSPTQIFDKKVYTFYMFADYSSELNKSYLKFIPSSSGYYSIHIGTEDFQDLDIVLFSDEEFTQFITAKDSTSLYGERLNYNLKANQTYYIMIENYSNMSDVTYSLLVTPSIDNGFYTKTTPMQIQLTSSDEFTLLSYIGYDSPLYAYDAAQDKHYIHVSSQVYATLYLKTFIAQNEQDLDIKVFSDPNYSQLIYESSAASTTQESMQIDFQANTEYFIEIQNFTNDSESSFVLSLDKYDF